MGSCEIEEFYRKNAENYFFCKILNAFISYSQCEINKSKLAQCKKCIFSHKKNNYQSQKNNNDNEEINSYHANNNKENPNSEASPFLDFDIMPNEVVAYRKDFNSFVVFGSDISQKYGLYNYNPVVYLYNKKKDKILSVIEEKDESKRAHNNLMSFDVFRDGGNACFYAPELLMKHFIGPEEKIVYIKCAADSQKKCIYIYNFS